ncbi:hypothetical protein AC629_32305 [Bradyrhizobium sp. NAS80.1]|uniref:transporter n=1 Tax=Bradyrhizobium sp. NAS80.1 TaxID=1680159 RepID=UPI00095B4E2B|nr:transporter [Bradyrhizobium sp. NAS80.1]OKO76962.1 hypothetical protein AC629_32305 [Bradyrhizobium sp. NAS80.1]
MGDGLELSARLFLDFASTNTATNYSTGAVADIDFAITEKFGRWQAGLAGYYGHQWQNDIHNGMIVAPNGKNLETIGVGPVVAYAIPEWNAVWKLKVLEPMTQRNSLNTTRVFLSFNKGF